MIVGCKHSRLQSSMKTLMKCTQVKYKYKPLMNIGCKGNNNIYPPPLGALLLATPRSPFLHGKVSTEGGGHAASCAGNNCVHKWIVVGRVSLHEGCWTMSAAMQTKRLC